MHATSTGFAPAVGRVAAAMAAAALLACGSPPGSQDTTAGVPSPAPTSTVPDAASVYGAHLRTSPGWEIYQAVDPVAAVTEIESYLTVEDQAKASSTVLRGRIRSVEVGRVSGGDGGFRVVYATLFVEPELVLAGEDPELVEGFVRVELPLPGVGDAADAPAVVEELKPLEAGEPTVFYLRHKAAEARSLGWSEEEAGEEQGWYRIVSSTGLVTASSGLADVTMYLPGSHNPPIVAEIESLDMAALERASAVG
jgi:hypothetical protein